MLDKIIHLLGGVETFGVISICIFFAFFIGMLIYAARLKKSFLNSMCELPLEEDPGAVDQTLSENRHE